MTAVIGRRVRALFNAHGLTVIAGAILLAWIVGYWFGNPNTHVGAFFGNAIADWAGLMLLILGTKFFSERGSKDAGSKLDRGRGWTRHLYRHSLSLLVVVSGIAILVAFVLQSPNGKWGQVTGNLLSEWTQVLGVLFLTKRFRERGSDESK